MESLAVKEGMEPRVEVKAISKLCDSFCSWDTGPVGATEIMTSRKAQQKRDGYSFLEDQKTTLPSSDM